MRELLAWIVQLLVGEKGIGNSVPRRMNNQTKIMISRLVKKRNACQFAAILCGLTSVLSVSTASATDWIVGPNAGAHFTTITSALASSSVVAGDTLRLQTSITGVPIVFAENITIPASKSPLTIKGGWWDGVSLQPAPNNFTDPIIKVDPGATLLLRALKVEFANARAIDNRGDLTCEIVKFNNNSGVSGGAIFSFFTNLTLDVVHFNVNTAIQHSGGAIHVVGGTLDMGFCRFDGNIALDRGGAIFGFANPTITSERCAFIGNIAINDGGAIAVSGGTLTFTNSSAVGVLGQARNEAIDGKGQGIWATGTITISALGNSTIKNNLGTPPIPGLVDIWKNSSSVTIIPSIPPPPNNFIGEVGP